MQFFRILVGILHHTTHPTTMMKSVLALLFLCLFARSVSAFQAPKPSTRVAAPTATSLNVFGNKKKSASELEKESKYWQGEWVCKDCGYIYNRVRLL
jgi:hypothetical protein